MPKHNYQLLLLDIFHQNHPGPLYEFSGFLNGTTAVHILLHQTLLSPAFGHILNSHYVPGVVLGSSHALHIT